ncbi:MAG: hypothetical protein ACOYB7_04905 [Mycobacterium sp.]
MTTAVTGLLQPATPAEEKRRRGVVLGAAATSILSLLGGIVFLLFSGQSPTQQGPLKPRSTPSTVASAPPTSEAPSSSGDLLGAMGANYADTGSGSAAELSGQSGSSPLGGAPLSPLQLPTAPQTPAVDWGEVLAPAAQAQQDAIAANLTGAITGPVIGLASSGINSGAILLGDVILYAAYTNNGVGLLNQLQTAIPAAAAVPALAAAGTVPAAAGAVPVADFSGLNTAFSAASSLPPIGLPAPPQLPQLPSLPTPDQALAALSALPALGALPGLPPGLPPPPGLPTPEQALTGAAAGAAAIAAIPALLPPPPPIGLPAFPPIGLPSIGFPSFGLPSITRLLGLPF